MSNKIAQSPEWRALKKHCTSLGKMHMRDLFRKDAKRFDRFHVNVDGFLFDYSKHRITPETIKLLVKLAKTSGLGKARSDLFSGKPVNKSENRAVLHTALRAPKNNDPQVERYVREAKSQIKKLSDAIRKDKNITDVINIGIGGSDLGPRMVCQALETIADGPRIHFLANLDGAEISQFLRKLKPENSFVIITSKTFTTLETMANAEIVWKWGRKDNFVAVTANLEAAKNFGIPKDNILPMKEWIGGRYSLWSVAGTSIAITAGFQAFEDLLKGAYAADKHFQETPLEKNIPVLMALLGIWYRNFWKFPAQAVLPYAHALKYFHAYIQQLDMESNGKAASVPTGPVVFGGTGTKVQHAFFQHLHQGSDITPADFIIAAKPNHKIKTHHQKLVANALAQAQALMQGAENKTEPHRHFEGNRPSSVLMLDAINPYMLGMLIAFYEHKIFVQGVIWGINSFDQWGVELGKVLANDIIQSFETGRMPGNADSSTRNLIHHTKSKM